MVIRLSVLRSWPRRRWLVATLGSLATMVLIAVPTAVIPNPVFGRAVDVTWWSYPTVVLSGLLAGLLLATYVREPGEPAEDEPQERASRAGLAGGFIAFFAVGCPVCNKLVLIALGSAGAMSWFAPLQPLLAVASIALMGYALWTRLGGEVACAITADVVDAAR